MVTFAREVAEDDQEWAEGAEDDQALAEAPSQG
jgi:hypothetical protein